MNAQHEGDLAFLGAKDENGKELWALVVRDKGSGKRRYALLPSGDKTSEAVGHEYTTNWIKPQQRRNEDGLCAAQRTAFEALQSEVP